jgi:hypothetical protein
MERETKSRCPFEAFVEIRHLLWSATTCDYPGAGLYFGLSLHAEHVALARCLTPKQVRTVLGGTVTLRPGEAPFPINYFAVRDPSAVKVKPVDKPPLHNGFRHVKITCNFERVQPTPETETIARQVDDHGRRLAAGKPPSTAAFLITIGLSMSREDQFHKAALLKTPAQGWDELYQRMRDLGCQAEDSHAS